MEEALLSKVADAMDPESLEPNKETFPCEVFSKVSWPEMESKSLSSFGARIAFRDEEFVAAAAPMLAALEPDNERGTYFTMDRGTALRMVLATTTTQREFDDIERKFIDESQHGPRIAYQTRWARIRHGDAWRWLAEGALLDAETRTLCLSSKALRVGIPQVRNYLETLARFETWMLPSFDSDHHDQKQTFVLVAPGAVIAARLLRHLGDCNKIFDPIADDVSRRLAVRADDEPPAKADVFDARATKWLWEDDEEKRDALLRRRTILLTALESAARTTRPQHPTLFRDAVRRVLPDEIPDDEASKCDVLGKALAEAFCLELAVDVANAAFASLPVTKRGVVGIDPTLPKKRKKKMTSSPRAAPAATPRGSLEAAWIALRAKRADAAADALLKDEVSRRPSGGKKLLPRSPNKTAAPKPPPRPHVPDDDDDSTSDDDSDGDVQSSVPRNEEDPHPLTVSTAEDDDDDDTWQQVGARQSRRQRANSHGSSTTTPTSERRRRQQEPKEEKPQPPPMPEREPEVDTAALSREVADMADALRDISQLRESYQLGACARLRGVVTRLWPSARVDVYGSVITGLAVPASDVDVVVSRVPPFWWTLLPKQQPLSVLAAELRLESWVSSAQTVGEHGIVPLVKIETAPVPTRHGNRSVIKIDVSFVDQSPFSEGEGCLGGSDGPNVSLGAYLNYYRSLQNEQYAASLLPQHQKRDEEPTPRASFEKLGPAGEMYESAQRLHGGVANTLFVLKLRCMSPELAPLVLVLKQLLYERGLNDPYTGGLSSYALVVMVAAVLQNYFLTPPNLRPNLGALLVETLGTYGTRHFDPRKFSVQIMADGTGPLVPLTPADTARFVPRVGSADYWRPADPVVIQDPVDPANNIGKACFGFRQVQVAFDTALRAIQLCDLCDLTRSALGAAFGSVEGETKHHDSVIKHLRAVWCPSDTIGSPHRRVIPDNDTTTRNILVDFQGDDDTLYEIEELRKLLNTRDPLSVGDVNRVQRTFRSLKASDDLDHRSPADLRRLVSALRSFARDRDAAWAAGRRPPLPIDGALADLERRVLSSSSERGPPPPTPPR